MVAVRLGLALKRDTEHIVQGIAQVGKGVFDIKLNISRADEFKAKLNIRHHLYCSVNPLLKN